MGLPSDFAAFSGHFEEWRMSRINKLISILGKDWFEGKTILELGCGYGHIGAELQGMGAIVTFAEGREAYLDGIKQRANGSEVLHLDQENKWDLGRKFDLVIHWGVMYHLDSWKQDLITSLKHGDMISLEGEVMDSEDEYAELKVKEDWYDGAKSGTGTRPSPKAVEKILRENGFSYTRYDDSDLNALYHKYDWKSGDIAGRWASGYRRFWMATRVVK